MGMLSAKSRAYIIYSTIVIVSYTLYYMYVVTVKFHNTFLETTICFIVVVVFQIQMREGVGGSSFG